jgi:hypothetical protein
LVLLLPCADAELLAFYSFDEQGDPLADSSGNNRDLTGTAGTNPVWGANIGFDGTGGYDFTDDRLIGPIDVNPGVMNAMTWGAWVRTDNLTAGLRKIMGHDNGGWDRTIGLDNRSGSFRYTSFTGIGRPVVGPSGPANTTDWTFLAAAHDQSAGTVTFYLDLDAATTEDALESYSESATFGSGFTTFAIGGLRPDNNSEAWNGAIDNVFIYDEFLDLAAVTALRDAFGIAQSPRIDSFTASPGFIDAGQSATLNWSVRNAESLSIDMAAPAANGENGSVMVSPTETTTYTLTATNAEGSDTAQVTVGVDVEAFEPRLTEFMASPDGTWLDGDGNDSDWIEIYNPNPFAFDLAGYQLMDGVNRWTFPSVQIPESGYLIVFASGQTDLNYLDDGGSLHTTFGLSSNGEDLRLLKPDGVTAVTAYLNVGKQETGVSYGLESGNGQPGYMSPSTPGQANGASFSDRVKDTKFDLHRGFYETPFAVTVTSATEGASISYTRDGSAPTSTHGTIIPPANGAAPAEAVVDISTTTTLRAIAFKDGLLPTNVDTHTYLFADDVIRQPANPPGFPSSWGVFTGVNGGPAGQPVPADYEMKQAIINANPAGMAAALRALPTLSIVADPDDLFSREGILANPFGGINGAGVHTQNPYEPNRRCSMEWIDSRGGPQTQVDCGVRLTGGWSRHYRATPKKSLSLLFQREFGAAKLNFPLFGEGEVDEFDRVVLKAIFSNAWVDAAVRPDYLRDLMLRETQLAMGQPSSRGTWVHLYLNGLYWGIYNPTERPDANWAASHFPGGEEDFDAVKHAGLCAPGCAVTNQFELLDGTVDAYHMAHAIADTDLSDPNNYAQFKQYVDVVNLADYIILNTYCANADWPGKNWYGFRKRAPGEGFKFVSWDAEYALENVNVNKVGSSGSNNPARLYDQARANEDFRVLFADRVHKHAFNGGALEVSEMQSRYRRLARVIDPAMDLEAARWGDNPHTRKGTPDYRKSNWESARNHILNNFLPNRHPVALSQYRAAGLYPAADAPEFNQHGGSLADGFSLTLSSPSDGTIYYTTDGTDPRLSASGDGSALVLVNETAPKRAIIAAQAGDEPSADWNTLTFDAGTWPEGTKGAGYELSAGNRYDPLIDAALDFAGEVDSANDETIYLRTEFTVADPLAFNVLTLKIRYDDGFVAYLNGHEVARRNVPGTIGVPVPWDAGADGDHRDAEAELFLSVDATLGLPHLRAGNNVLAIHGANRDVGSSDFLIWPLLEGSNQGSGPSPSAFVYNGEVNLIEAAVVKARLRSNSGEWSALTEAPFTLATVPASAQNLVISRVHYHPSDPTPEEVAAGFEQSRNFEYLELLNYGDVPISLAGLRFVDGVLFTFDSEAVFVLAPGERGLVVDNAVAFTMRYGTGPRILGEFDRGNLNNDGEQIALLKENDADLWRFTYNDAGAWPDSPDGHGPALSLIDPNNPPDNAGLSLPENWRPSGQGDGSPGDDTLSLDAWLATQPDPEPLADPDGDGINQLLAFASGALDSAGAAGFLPAVSVASVEVAGASESYPVIDVRELIGALGVETSLEVSLDLNSWMPAGVVLVSTTDKMDGTLVRRYRTADPFDPVVSPRMFLRLSVVRTN